MIQQQIEIISFQQVYIQKHINKANKTNKIRDWLTLLKAYHQNNLFTQKDKTIHKMHYKFVLNQQFWLQEIDRKQNLSQCQLCVDDIQLMMLAVDDGYYERAAEKIFNVLVRELRKFVGGKDKNNSNNNSNSNRGGKLRANYLVAKIEKLISVFRRSKNFFPTFREYYIQINDEKKIRQLYYRELKNGYNNHDVIYDQYCLWQKNQKQLASSSKIYQLAKQAYQNRIMPTTPDLQTQLNNTSTFQPTNYLKLVQKLQSQMQKLRYLRIICLGRHQLANQYFQKLQYVYRQNQQHVLKCYQNMVDIVPEIEVGYLRFLVRRINKHVYGEQGQEYNNVWAANVQFFREEITNLISKPRLTPKTQESIRELYYTFWADVETTLVKDKPTVCQLYETLLQIKNSVEIYTKYSQAMIRLGFYADAKQILKRSCQAHKYDYEAYKIYENFIAVYGDINDAVQFRKLKELQKQQRTLEQANSQHRPQQTSRMEQQPNIQSQSQINNKNENQPSQNGSTRNPQKQQISSTRIQSQTQTQTKTQTQIQNETKNQTFTNKYKKKPIPIQKLRQTKKFDKQHEKRIKQKDAQKRAQLKNKFCKFMNKMQDENQTARALNQQLKFQKKKLNITDQQNQDYDLQENCEVHDHDHDPTNIMAKINQGEDNELNRLKNMIQLQYLQHVTGKQKEYIQQLQAQKRQIQKFQQRRLKSQQQKLKTKSYQKNKNKLNCKSRQEFQSIQRLLIAPQQSNQPLLSVPVSQHNSSNSQFIRKKLHSDSGNTIFIKGFPVTYRQPEIRALIKNTQSIKQIRLIQKKGVYQNYCYVDMISAQQAQKQVNQNQYKNQYIVAISKPPSSYSQANTLFLAALPNSVTVQKIKQLFKQQWQKIVDIRIKLNQNKNIAYVDFSTPQIAKQTFQKYSKQPLLIDNKKILLRQCNVAKPTPIKKQHLVVILKKLAFKAKQKDIVQFFKDFSIEDVYIPLNQDGTSRGYAYVKFKNQEEYKHVLEMKEGTIKGRKFQIHKSDRDITRPKNKGQEKDKVNNQFFSNLFK